MGPKFSPLKKSENPLDILAVKTQFSSITLRVALLAENFSLQPNITRLLPITTNSEDPDEMPHVAACHRVYTVCLVKKDLKTKNIIF